jgi:ppGpp synthetase/RelA/SpoT-type nucleotidyltranferase
VDFTHVLDAFEQSLRQPIEAHAEWVANELRCDPLLLQTVRPLLFHRVKTRKSLSAKLEKEYRDPEQGPVTPQNLEERVEDLGGVRVVVHNRADIARVLHVVYELERRNRWQILGTRLHMWTRDLSDDTRVDPKTEVILQDDGSYRSRHFIIASAGAPKPRCELQVRSVLEEAVFEARHRLVYKATSPPLPPTTDSLTWATEVAAGLDGLLTACYSWEAHKE